MAKVCVNFMRVILVILSILFMLLGLAVVALSLFVKLSPAISELTGDPLWSSISICLYVLIGIGSFMAILGFIGCFGACRKSTICLGIYITILFILIVAEIAIGIILVINTKMMMKAQKFADNTIDELVNEYNGKPAKGQRQSDVLALIHRTFKCCGAAGPGDFAPELPPSCCKGGKKPCGQRSVSALDLPGCKKQYKKVITSTGFPIVIGVVLGTAVIELIGIAFAIAICCHSRRQDAGYVSVVT